MWYNGKYLVEKEDLLPCTCGSKNLEVFANLVECIDCGKMGPDQNVVEFLCDWRLAIEDWNDMIKKETENGKSDT